MTDTQTGTGPTPEMIIDEAGVYVGHNEDLIYEDPEWEYPEVVTYVNGNIPTYVSYGVGVGEGEGPAPVEEAGASGPAMTVVNRSGGYATVRTNRSASFSGSVPFGGSISGTLPAGATMRGRDRNGNGVPDILEGLLKRGQLKFN